MRKPLFKTLLCLSLLVPFTGNGQDKNALEAGFMNPAEKVQTSVIGIGSPGISRKKE